MPSPPFFSPLPRSSNSGRRSPKDQQSGSNLSVHVAPRVQGLPVTISPERAPSVTLAVSTPVTLAISEPLSPARPPSSGHPGSLGYRLVSPLAAAAAAPVPLLAQPS